MRIYLLIPLILFFSCQNREQTIAENKLSGQSSVITSPTFKFDYVVQKKKCVELFNENRVSKTDSSITRLTRFITDSLLSCWYGTPWDFNGTTETPGQGKIACGYFVTTVLRDAGLPVNRVRLAQCASKKLIEETCVGNKTYWNQSLPDFVETVKQKEAGLYIVGLDYHTGFILNDGNDVYFIHSGVYSPRCALRERAIESKTLQNTKCRVLGKISF